MLGVPPSFSKQLQGWQSLKPVIKPYAALKEHCCFIHFRPFFHWWHACNLHSTCQCSGVFFLSISRCQLYFHHPLTSEELQNVTQWKRSFLSSETVIWHFLVFSEISTASCKLSQQIVCAQLSWRWLNFSHGNWNIGHAITGGQWWGTSYTGQHLVIEEGGVTGPGVNRPTDRSGWWESDPD